MSRQSRIRKNTTALNGTALQRAAQNYDHQVIVRSFTTKMEAHRRWAKDKWGDKYPIRVGMYKAQIHRVCKQRKCGAVEAALKHIMPVLVNSPKLQGDKLKVVKIALSSAALDLMDEFPDTRD